MSRLDLALVRSLVMLPGLLLPCACSGDDSGSVNGTGGSGGVINAGGGGSSTGGTSDASSGGQPGSGGVIGTGGQPGSGGVVGTGGSGGTAVGGAGGQATGSGGTTVGDASGTGGTGSVTYKDICGCTFATAADHTGQATVTVSFGGTLGFTYSPKCIIVSPGTDVTFSGSFGTHPLRAYTDAANTDPGNPIQATSSGSTATFTFSTAGSFGYYCSQHVGLGMCGAVYVAQ